MNKYFIRRGHDPVSWTSIWELRERKWIFFSTLVIASVSRQELEEVQKALEWSDYEQRNQP